MSFDAKQDKLKNLKKTHPLQPLLPSFEPYDSLQIQIFSMSMEIKSSESFFQSQLPYGVVITSDNTPSDNPATMQKLP